jgi:MSHA pilin protein MshC
MRYGRVIEGFTLVELCSVLVIAGILVAIAGPKFLDTPAFSQRGYTDELAGAIRSAEATAVASGCAVQLTISRGSGYDAELPQAVGCSGGYVPGARPVVTGVAPSNADASASAILLLNPDGSVVGPTTLSVVGSPSGLTAPLILAIDPQSGFVTVP